MSNLVLWALAVGNAALFLAQAGRDDAILWRHAAIPALYTAGYVALLLYLRYREQGRPSDSFLIAAACALSGLGLAAIVRIDPDLAERQLRWLFLGLIAFAGVAHAPVWESVRRYKYVWAAAALLLLLGTALFGVQVGGARSWIRVGPLGFQPVEFVKILLVFFLSSHLAESKAFLSGRASGARQGWLPPMEHLGPLMIMALLFIFILVVQRDLGAALLLFGLFALMLFTATGLARYLAAGGVVVALGASLAALFFDHVRVRFAVWLDPWSLADGRGYQIVESLFALGAGGLIGTGWGRGLADRIPAVETDFVYSLIAEELGLMGAAALLFLLAVISVRSLAPAFVKDQDDVERLGVAGLSLLFALQSVLIVGGVTRLLPVTGVTLPFVSYGGSSLVASFLQLGLVYNRLQAVLHQQQARRRSEVPEWTGV